jgi:hypothetical protein
MASRPFPASHDSAPFEHDNQPSSADPLPRIRAFGGSRRNAEKLGHLGQRKPGAQTERRGDAGPVGVLLGGEDPTGRLLCYRLSVYLLSRSVTGCQGHSLFQAG